MAFESSTQLEQPTRGFDSEICDVRSFNRFVRGNGVGSTSDSEQPGSDKATSTAHGDLSMATATPPMDMPRKDGHVSDHHHQRRRDLDCEGVQTSSGNGGRQHAHVEYAQRVCLEDGTRPTLEEKLPRLSLNTRPRGRSLLDEIQKKRTPAVEDLKQERSALRNVSITRDLASEDAVHTPALSSSNRGASPAVDELLTPQDRLAEAYASPTTYTPMSGSPGSAAGSWLGMYGSRPPSFRRRSNRSNTNNSLHDSPAAQFLRQYSTSNINKTPPAPDEEGQEAGDFILGKQIGKGGFSVVREAFRISEPSSKPTLAVKIVRKRIFGMPESENEEAQVLLDHEMEVWRTVSHEGIVPLTELFVTEFATFAFMPLATHGSLFDAVKKVYMEGLDLDLVRTYAGQIAEVLRYLHQDVRIAHRDIKLENFLLISDEQGNSSHPDSQMPRVILTDFGFASYLNDDRSLENIDAGSPVTQTGSTNKKALTKKEIDDDQARGSLPYAAPELLNRAKGKQPPLSPRPDMWAFGVMLYTMVTGRRPFSGDFEPKVIECIKAADCDWNLLDEKCKAALPSSSDQEDHTSSHGAGASSEKKGHVSKAFKKSRGGSNARSNSTTGGIAKTDSWVRSCSQIIVSDGIDPQAITDVVRGCITVNPEERWDIMRVVESTWLASERKSD